MEGIEVLCTGTVRTIMYFHCEIPRLDVSGIVVICGWTMHSIALIFRARFTALARDSTITGRGISAGSWSNHQQLANALHNLIVKFCMLVGNTSPLVGLQ